MGTNAVRKLREIRATPYCGYGERIHVELAKEVPAVGVDTAEDLEKCGQFWRSFTDV